MYGILEVSVANLAEEKQFISQLNVLIRHNVFAPLDTSYYTP
jgi:hypothetical protein